MLPTGLEVFVDDGCTVSDVRVDGKPTPIRAGIDGNYWNLPQGRVVVVEATINGKPYLTRGYVSEGELYPVFRCTPPKIQVEWLGSDPEKVIRALKEERYNDLPK